MTLSEIEAAEREVMGDRIPADYGLDRALDVPEHKMRDESFLRASLINAKEFWPDVKADIASKGKIINALVATLEATRSYAVRGHVPDDVFIDQINAALALAAPPEGQVFERMTEEELLAAIDDLGMVEPPQRMISDERLAELNADPVSPSEIEAAENEVHDRLERAFGGMMNLPRVAIDEPGWLDAGYKADRQMQRKLELAGLDRITQAGRIRFHEQLREGQGYNDATGFRLRCWMAALRYPFLSAWAS
ncbi:MAG: hypothetical protein EOR99_35065 [Mesorhizobium sp.]|nr:MAG: hypothetical protein EOR99_35065 [Mesorhizobium sp.]